MIDWAKLGFEKCWRGRYVQAAERLTMPGGVPDSVRMGTVTMAMPERLSGIICACLTPFDEHDRVDYRALEREIEYIVGECGVDAISIGAVEASEYTRLTWEEREELIRRAIAMVDGRLPTIAGCSIRTHAWFARWPGWPPRPAPT